MSEWSYYQKNETIDNVKRVKDNSDAALREVRALKEQFAQFMRQQQAVMENQQAILHELKALKGAVEGMHAEMYPHVEETKPSLKKAPFKSNP
ncbi:MAG: hypothetical protein GC185_03040 [Alphaproteobacteria bacterium]|nr:hypothetical protein [Alphaproteobacteria bacterium]